MTRSREILVGVDGSAASLHALDWAAQEAVIHGLGLRLVCGYALPSFAAASLDGGYAALDDSAIRAGAQAVVADAVEHVANVGVPVSSHVTVGDAAAVLIDESARVVMAVVGTRGGGGFAERLLGTVSSALPAHAQCPTIVVPTRRKPKGTEEAPLVVRPVHRVVVGLDGSPQAELALRWAIREAKVWGAELVAVTGVPVTSGSGTLAWLPAAVDHQQVLEDVATALDVLIDRVAADEPGAPEIKRTVRDGTGAQLLTEASGDTDLLVVGSRGRGGFAGLLLGSTSQAVLHHAQCPVAIVTQKGKLADDE
ncbi:MAG TPA: universal stress protein [Propionicimonas sp.]